VAEIDAVLGVVLVGGLAFATRLTPTVVPALMGLLYDLTGRWESSPSSPAVLPAEAAPAMGRSLAHARPGEGERI
jgi:HAE1 family hydrophobic/amphiphilic exporter-1